MIAGAIVVTAALITEVKYQPPFWLHAVLWLPLTLAVTLWPLRAIKSLLDRAAIPSQGRRGPADRAHVEMTRGCRQARLRLRHLHAGDGRALRRPRALAVAAPRREARADRGADRAAGGRARAAAAAVAMGALTPRATNSAASPSPRPMRASPTRWSIRPARRCATDISGPGTWAFLPARLASRRDGRDQCRLRREHDAGSRRRGPRGGAARTDQPVDADRLSPLSRKRRACSRRRPSTSKRLWFARDVGAMAQALRLGQGRAVLHRPGIAGAAERHPEARAAARCI